MAFSYESEKAAKVLRAGAQETCKLIEDGVLKAVQKRNPGRDVGTPVKFYTANAYRSTVGVTVVELEGVDARGNSYVQLFVRAEDLRDYVKMCQSILDAVVIEEQKQCARQKAN